MNANGILESENLLPAEGQTVEKVGTAYPQSRIPLALPRKEEMQRFIEEQVRETLDERK